jgi:hypothetical protein
MRTAAGRPRGMSVMIRIVAAVSTVLLFAPGFVGAADECLTVREGTAREIGRFSPHDREKAYCVHGRAGQAMKVTITPLSSDMATQGHIVSPSGQQDGGPGGVIFDDKLTEEGRYEIIVGRLEKTPGAFELSVELR